MLKIAEINFAFRSSRSKVTICDLRSGGVLFHVGEPFVGGKGWDHGVEEPFELQVIRKSTQTFLAAIVNSY